MDYYDQPGRSILKTRHGQLQLHTKQSVTVKVLYPYDANNNDELSLKPGDIIEVSRSEWSSGRKWLKGSKANLPYRSSSIQSYFPKEFIEMHTMTEKTKSTHYPHKGNIVASFKGKQYNFAENPEDWLDCIICCELAYEPQITKCCAKTMCGACIKKWNSNCPNCRKPKYGATEDPRTNQRIPSLLTHCPNTECSWKGFLKDVEGHKERDCKFEGVTCSQCKQVKLLREDLQAHLENDCQERSIPCPAGCSQTQKGVRRKSMTTAYFRYSELISSHYKKCPQWPMRCPQKCDNQLSLTRATLRDHIDSQCPETVVACEFSSVGCTVKNRRREIQRHLTEGTTEHLSLLMKEYTKLQTDYSQLKKEHQKMMAMNTELLN